MKIKGAMDEVYTNDAQSFLLADILLIEHADMNENFRGLSAWLGLETNAQPAMALFFLSSDSVCEYKKAGFGTALIAQAFEEQIVFIGEHGVKPLAADIAICRPINSVANSHVIGRDGFGNRSGSATGAKEPAGNFLAGANFCKSAVSSGILVNALSFLAGIQQVVGQDEYYSPEGHRVRAVMIEAFEAGASLVYPVCCRPTMTSRALANL